MGMGGARVSVTVEGGEALIEALRKMGADVDAEIGESARVGGEVIRAEANRRAPGPYVVMEVEEGRGVATAEVGPDEEHWYYRFFETGAGPHEITGAPLAFEGSEGLVVTGRAGHPGMAAKPFLRPAFDGKRDEAEGAVGDHLRGVVEG